MADSLRRAERDHRDDRHREARDQPGPVQAPVPVGAHQLPEAHDDVVGGAVPGHRHDECQHRGARGGGAAEQRGREETDQHRGGELDRPEAAARREAQDQHRDQRARQRHPEQQGQVAARRDDRAQHHEADAQHLHPGLRLGRVGAGQAPSPQLEAGSEDGDAQLARQDRRRDPPGNDAQIGADAVADDDEHLVGDGIQQRPQHRDAVLARQVAVDRVGQADQRPQDDGDDARPLVAIRQRAHERQADQAGDGDLVGRYPHPPRKLAAEGIAVNPRFQIPSSVLSSPVPAVSQFQRTPMICQPWLPHSVP